MELKIIEIREHSTEDERIFMKAVEDCNLSDFIVYDETFDEEGNPSNLLPHMHRLPNIEVQKGEYISLRTQGKDKRNKKGTLDDEKTPCFYLYWGLEESILNNDGDTIHLVRIIEEQSKSAQ